MNMDLFTEEVNRPARVEMFSPLDNRRTNREEPMEHQEIRRKKVDGKTHVECSCGFTHLVADREGEDDHVITNIIVCGKCHHVHDLVERNGRMVLPDTWSMC
jgi:hypothetical protein